MFPDDQWLNNQTTHKVRELLFNEGELITTSVYFDCEDNLISIERIVPPMGPATHLARRYIAPSGTRVLVINNTATQNRFTQYKFEEGD